MEFPHIARWNFAMIEDFGSVMPTGYLFTGKTIVLSVYPEPEGLVGYFNAKPGEVYARWLSQDTYPPENLGNQFLIWKLAWRRCTTLISKSVGTTM